jgi:hypothetical protein
VGKFVPKLFHKIDPRLRSHSLDSGAPLMPPPLNSTGLFPGSASLRQCVDARPELSFNVEVQNVKKWCNEKLSTHKLIDPNICQPEYLPTRIFVNPNIRLPKYSSTQIFV